MKGENSWEFAPRDYHYHNRSCLCCCSRGQCLTWFPGDCGENSYDHLFWGANALVSGDCEGICVVFCSGFAPPGSGVCSVLFIGIFEMPHFRIPDLLIFKVQKQTES